MNNKLFLFDAMALIYRAHFALNKNPIVTSFGLNTSAILGFANTIWDVIQKEQPSHVAVVSDSNTPTFRHKEYSEYKAHRDAMPDDIRSALPYIRKIVDAFQIPFISVDGYEADDIIGTLAKDAANKGFTVYMMTPDKDYAQLVQDNIFMYKPARMGNAIEILGVNEVLQKWEISKVEQVIDILGLWGDASDNIPGIPGIGEKTAKVLIQKYGSVENIIANAHELKGKQRENIETYAEQGLLSKSLVTIDINAPVKFVEDDFCFKTPNKENLEPVLAELEFRALYSRIFKNETNSSDKKSKKKDAAVDLFSVEKDELNESDDAKEQVLLFNYANINTVQHDYKCVSEIADIEKLVFDLECQRSVAIDTETTSVDATLAELVGMSFSWEENKAYYVPVPENREDAIKLVSLFKRFFENVDIQKVGQNIKYDIIVLKSYGVSIQGELFDTMLAHYLLDSESQHNMNYLSEKYLEYSPIPIDALIGKKGVSQASMRDVALDKIALYASEDADVTFKLKQKLSPELNSHNAEKLLRDIEAPLVYVLADMEMEGVRVDVDALRSYSEKLSEEIAVLEAQIYLKAGQEFNIASPKQLGEILFDKLQLDPKAKKTKTGQYQTGEDVLEKYLYKNDIVQDIVTIRQLQKLKSTYVDALPKLINSKTGRIHSSFNQAVAATGRLSSTNPNLQNIPVRTAWGKEIRKAFVARDNNHVLLSIDYSQIELRVIASLSGDKNMIEAFNKGEDIHTATAAKVYGVKLKDVTKDQRRNAKAVNFGIIYGQSAFGLAQNLGISRTEAQNIICAYFEQYPMIKDYIDYTVENARKTGYVETIFGRRRYLKDILSRNANIRAFAERNAVNAPIQGSAADLIKVSMINIHKELNRRNSKTKMIIQVHDELVFDVPKDELEEIKVVIENQMMQSVKLNVPILVDSSYDYYWIK